MDSALNINSGSRPKCDPFKQISRMAEKMLLNQFLENGLYKTHAFGGNHVLNAYVIPSTYAHSIFLKLIIYGSNTQYVWPTFYINYASHLGLVY
jgi:hypothetical protein